MPRKTRKRKLRRKQTLRKRSNKKQRGGSWMEPYLSTALNYQQLSTELDQSNHYFIISGSTAILFHINELLTEDFHKLTPVDQELLTSLQSQIHKPNDLDFKYIEDPNSMFENAVIRKTSPTQLHSLTILTNTTNNIHTCPSYVNLGAYRACTPMEKDISFHPIEKDAMYLFDSIDFTQIRPPRRQRKESDMFVVKLYNDQVDVMGLQNLIRMYEQNYRQSNNAKEAILKSLFDIVSKYPDLLAKYNGQQIKKNSDF